VLTKMELLNKQDSSPSWSKKKLPRGPAFKKRYRYLPWESKEGGLSHVTTKSPECLTVATTRLKTTATPDKLHLNLSSRTFFLSRESSFTNYPTTKVKMPSTHKKEKPWDTDDIDKWKVSYN